MIPARLLPFLNAAGCAILVGFIIVQWYDGKSVARELHEARSQTIHEKNARLDAEKTVRQLQSDVEGLKASIDSIQQAAEIAEKDLAARTEEAQALAKALEEADEQLKAWEEAVQARDEALAARDALIKERDEKLRTLNSTLVSTRKRLDEAVAKLRQAGQ